MTSRLIIEYPDGMDPQQALIYVSHVVAEGQTSKNKHGPHFCWVTTFWDGTVIHTRVKRHAAAADSFLITLPKSEDEKENNMHDTNM